MVATFKRYVIGFVERIFPATCELCGGKKMRHLLHSPYSALAVACLIWGMSAPITKLALTEIGPASLILARSTIAAIILFPFILRYKHNFTVKEQLYIGMSSCFAIFLHILLIYLALPLVPSINAPIINAISPFVLLLFARFLFHETVAKRKYVGIGLGLVGVACITVLPILVKGQGDILGAVSGVGQILGLPSQATSGSAWLGNGLLVAGVVLGAIGTLCIKPIKHIPGHVIAFWQFALVACFALPLSLQENMSFLNLHMGKFALFGIVYNAIFSSVIAYTLHNSSIQKVHAADLGLFSYLAPISALLLGIPLLHEYPNLWFIIGSVLVLAGVWVAEHKIRHHVHA